MKTVDKIYKDLYDKPEDWDYYQKGVDYGYPFDSEDYRICSDFIEKFFRDSGKKETTFKGFAEKLGKRSQHIVSTFFLGVYLYKNSDFIHKNVHKELSKKYPKEYCDSEIERSFTFVWFLICLFHDMGYLIEEDKNRNTPKYLSFQDFLDSECINKKLSNLSGVPRIYAKIYRSYFAYRANEHRTNDHGICAAFLLFKDLCEIRERKEKNPNTDPDDKLYWGKELIRIYNFASWIILAHNIWYVNSSNLSEVEKYNCAGLNQLIRHAGEYKICFETHPTFFLFCLIDSIEFLKRVKDVSLLEKIELGIEEGDNKNCKIVVESKLTCGYNDSVMKSIEDLNNWLTTTKKDGDKKIRIDLHPAKLNPTL